ncbi:hypothetical protein KL933_004302 [Ogataea haglerorum]|uniref:Uncharacterized protein n=1 Tax=Ogataea haglerorum TaxID=1937702 RepID=A0AAN6HZR5_9ASCO|nr:hypothetical protein KL950_004735 [Ogataea haglerorum]KAG7725288.1 hypothetical protein KL933_004302 [Ogataea haglerorum]KAG7735516.1 hypothetical protein KL932_004464 [Ogataea haglerorum]KAG7736467.1 hypothetical protein KL923_004674 [Ogataea haglerorum]KAG7762462.1 hypothetical protein KL946_004578 [Ogataea haglerorum]
MAKKYHRDNERGQSAQKQHNTECERVGFLGQHVDSRDTDELRSGVERCKPPKAVKVGVEEGLDPIEVLREHDFVIPERGDDSKQRRREHKKQARQGDGMARVAFFSGQRSYSYTGGQNDSTCDLVDRVASAKKLRPNDHSQRRRCRPRHYVHGHRDAVLERQVVCDGTQEKERGGQKILEGRTFVVISGQKRSHGERDEEVLKCSYEVRRHGFELRNQLHGDHIGAAPRKGEQRWKKHNFENKLATFYVGRDIAVARRIQAAQSPESYS